MFAVQRRPYRRLLEASAQVLAASSLFVLAGCPRTSADVSTDTAPDSAGAAPTSGGASEPGDADAGAAAGGGEAGAADGGAEAGSPGMNFEVVAGTAPCKTDADCFPTECCHPTACGNTQADCADTMCTMDCKTGTMDCGGGCACVEGKCAARILVSIGSE